MRLKCHLSASKSFSRDCLQAAGAIIHIPFVEFVTHLILVQYYIVFMSP